MSAETQDQERKRLEPNSPRLKFHGADSRKDNHFSVACWRSHLKRNSMFCPPRNRQMTAGRRHHVLEWLEPRCLLAGLPPSIASVSPYDGEKLDQSLSPPEIDIWFNGINAGALLTGFDVQIERLNPDGTKSPVLDPSTAISDESDPTGMELIVPMQFFDTNTFQYENLTLLPGHYEVDLVGGTGIAAAASGAGGPGPELWDPSQDHAISTFTVLGGGTTFADAQTIAANGPLVLGSVNPADPASAVDFYAFSLPQGHFWQVGVSVSTDSINSGLLPALTLFRADGTVVATRDSGTGLATDPNDPYIFTGLGAGTYYIGVSGAGNLPYGSAGYDPINGIPGTAGLVQPGGLFQLGLTAVSHDQPASLVDFTVNRADAFDPSPTSLTLTFSAPINLGNLFIPDTPETAVEVVDASGRIWPTTSLAYDVNDARLTLVIDEPLPAGSYSLILPSDGGLTDLAGEPVVAPDGVLATWTVAPASGLHNPLDLGVLWPGTSQASSRSQSGEFTINTALAPGQDQTYRWVVTVPGFYKLQTQIGSGNVAIVNFGDGKTTVLDSASSGPLNNYLMNLSAGVYQLRFTNVGSQPVELHWSLKSASLDWEKILNNGVGQISALSLGFLSPTPSDAGSNSVPGFPGMAGANTLTNFAGSIGPVPTNLLVTLDTSLIGQPTLQSQNVTPVGPSVETGSTAFAGNTTGLIPGIRYGSQLSAEEGSGADAETSEPALADAGTAPMDNALRVVSVAAPPGADPEAGSARADALRARPG